MKSEGGNHPSITDCGDGILEHNFKKYDLKTRAGRDAWSKECMYTVAYMAMAGLRSQVEKGEYGKILKPGVRHLTVSCRLFDPWATHILLTEELGFQIETLDLVE